MGWLLGLGMSLMNIMFGHMYRARDFYRWVYIFTTRAGLFLSNGPGKTHLSNPLISLPSAYYPPHPRKTPLIPDPPSKADSTHFPKTHAFYRYPNHKVMTFS